MSRSTRRLRTALLSSVVCMVPISLVVTTAEAAETQGEGAAISSGAAAASEVVVTGQRESLTVSTKRAAQGVVDSISQAQLQKLPTTTVAEALTHVVGVSVTPNNDNERGRNFDQSPAVRGLDSSYNNVSIDGMPIAQTDFTGTGVSSRAVALDAVPSSAVSLIEVFKTYSPDRDPQAIGGALELTTRDAFQNGGRPFLLINARGGLNGLNSQPYPQSPANYHVDLSAAHLFGESNQFGAALNINYERTNDFTYDNATTDSIYYNYYTGSGAQLSGPTATSFAIPQQSKAWIIEEKNEKADVTAKLDWRPSRRLKAFVEGGYYYDANDATRNEMILTAAGTPTITSSTTGSFPLGDVEVGGQYSPLHRSSYNVIGAARYDITDQDALTLRASDSFSSWFQPEYMVKYIDSTVNSPTAGSAVKTLAANAFGYQLYSDYSNFNMNPTQFDNPDNYGGFYWRYRHRSIETDNNALKLDYEHNAEVGDIGLGFKAGVDLRQTRNRLDYRTPEYDPNVSGTTTLAQAQGFSSFGLPHYSSLPFLLINVDKAFAYLTSNPSQFHMTNQNANDHVNDFQLREDTLDGYGMVVLNFDRLHAMAGVREDSARVTVSGYQQQPNPQGVANSAFDGGPYPAFLPITTRSKYDNLLPAASIDFEPVSAVQLRGAISQTVGRPDYSSYSPSSGVAINYGAGAAGANTLTITRGNPGLKPRLSTNYDLALDWYPDSVSVISIAPFYKSIKDEIYNITTVGTASYEGQTLLATTTTPVNAASTSVQGIEMEAVYADYGRRVSWLRGLSTDFNYTLLAGKARVAYSTGIGGALVTTSREVAGLINQPKYVANFIFNYDRGLAFGSIALNETGRSLRTLTANAVWQDVYWAPRTRLDLKAGIHLRSDLDAFVGIENLADDTVKSVTGPGKNLLKDESYTGRTFWFGLTYHPF